MKRLRRWDDLAHTGWPRPVHAAEDLASRIRACEARLNERPPIQGTAPVSESLDSHTAESIERLVDEVRRGAGSRLLAIEGLGHGDGSPRLQRVPWYAVLLPGTVASVAVEEALLAWLAGVPVVLMPSRRNAAIVADAVEATLRRVGAGGHGEVPGSIAVLDPRDRQSVLRATPPFVRVYGTDETGVLVRATVAPSTRVQIFGSMTSEALVVLGANGESPASSNVRGAVDRLVDDVVRWGYAGCMSPRTIHAVGSAAGFEAFRAGLVQQMNQREAVRVPHTPAEDLVLARMLGGVVHGRAPAVVEWSDSASLAVDVPPLLGAVSLFRYDAIDEVRIGRSSVGESLSSLGVWPTTLLEESEERGWRRRAHRVVALGSMQTPRFDRLHDGQRRWRVLFG